MNKLLSPKKSGRRIAKFKNHLEAITATPLQTMSLEDLDKFIPEFVMMTWCDDIEDLDKKILSRMSRRDIVMHMFEGRTLPTALETVRLTFSISGLTATGVTHLIRHRNFSFSAQTTDSRDARDDAYLRNDSIDINPELKRQFTKLCQQLNNFYCDAVDSGISLYDARQLMPRAVEATYNMSGCITDFMRFINVRLGRQNQPTEDNILAMRLRDHILDIYPFLAKKMPIEPMEWHYINAVKYEVSLNTFEPSTQHQAILDNQVTAEEQGEFYHNWKRDDALEQEKFHKLMAKRRHQ